MVSSSRLRLIVQQLHDGRACRVKMNTHHDKLTLNVVLLEASGATAQNFFAIELLQRLEANLIQYVVTDHGHKNSSGDSYVSFLVKPARPGLLLPGHTAGDDEDDDDGAGGDDPGGSGGPRHSRRAEHDQHDPWHGPGASDPWSGGADDARQCGGAAKRPRRRRQADQSSGQLPVPPGAERPPDRDLPPGGAVASADDAVVERIQALQQDMHDARLAICSNRDLLHQVDDYLSRLPEGHAWATDARIELLTTRRKLSADISDSEARLDAASRQLHS